MRRQYTYELRTTYSIPGDRFAARRQLAQVRASSRERAEQAARDSIRRAFPGVTFPAPTEWLAGPEH